MGPRQKCMPHRDATEEVLCTRVVIARQISLQVHPRGQSKNIFRGSEVSIRNRRRKSDTGCGNARSPDDRSGVNIRAK